MVSERILQERLDWYDDSTKGRDWYYCSGCSAHIHEDDFRENDGYCPGCDHLADVQECVRGAI